MIGICNTTINKTKCYKNNEKIIQIKSNLPYLFKQLKTLFRYEIIIYINSKYGIKYKYYDRHDT